MTGYFPLPSGLEAVPQLISRLVGHEVEVLSTVRLVILSIAESGSTLSADEFGLYVGRVKKISNLKLAVEGHEVQESPVVRLDNVWDVGTLSPGPIQPDQGFQISS